jgi:hypothetical protein
MIPFLLKSTLSLFIVLGFYKIYLENEKLHTFNRFFLLFSVLFCLYLPFLGFEKPETLSSYSFDEQFIIVNNTSSNSVEIQKVSMAQRFSMEQFFLCIYAIGFILFLIRFVKNIYHIKSLKKQSEVIYNQSFELVLTEKEIAPCSFFRSIFFNKKDYLSGKIPQEIVAHECGHTSQLHSLDIMIIEIIHLVFWFNPVFIFFKKAIQMNHEFLADQAALKQTESVALYQEILIQNSQKTALNYSSSSIFQLTKQRLKMMTKRTSASVALLKKLSIVPVIMFLVFVFSKTIIGQQPVLIKIMKPEKLTLKDVNVENGEFTILRERDPNDKKSRMFTFKKYTELSQEEKDHMGEILYSEKAQPTEEMMKNWKNPKIVGLWFNEKKSPNSILNKYKKEDIAEYFVSKLYGAARTSVTYKYQVDIQTHDYYENVYLEEVKKKPMIQIDLRTKK